MARREGVVDVVEDAKARLVALREKKARADQSVAAADAVYETLLTRLRAEHQCDSLDAAETQLGVLQQKGAAIRPRLQTLLSELEQKLQVVEAG